MHLEQNQNSDAKMEVWVGGILIFPPKKRASWGVKQRAGALLPKGSPHHVPYV